MDVNILLERATKFWKWVLSRNYRNPRVVLTTIAILLLPFVARQYVYTGLLMGILLAISILWLVEKLPANIRKLIVKYPLFTDMAFTAVSIVGMAGVFGSGLILAITAIICDIVLSFCLPHITVEDLHMEPA